MKRYFFILMIPFLLLSLTFFVMKKHEANSIFSENKEHCLPLFNDLKEGDSHKVLQNPYNLSPEDFCSCLRKEIYKPNKDGVAEWIMAKLFEDDKDFKNVYKSLLEDSLYAHYPPAIRMAINFYLQQKDYEDAYRWIVILEETGVLFPLKERVYEQLTKFQKEIVQEYRTPGIPEEMQEGLSMNLDVDDIIEFCPCMYKKYKRNFYEQF
ncbi:MAG: hypothetical protein ACTSXV_00605 [Alphaproteobacteria bacterium]